MKYCTRCGTQVDDECVICPHCGCYADKKQESGQSIAPEKDLTASPRSRTLDAILCFFLGGLGIHCFYEGKIGKGILYIFTGGVLGIGCLIDFIMILLGSQKDKEGLPIKNWQLD